MSAKDQIDMFFMILIGLALIALAVIIYFMMKDRKGKVTMDQWRKDHNGNVSAPDAMIACHFQYTYREWEQMDNLKRARLRDRLYRHHGL